MKQLENSGAIARLTQLAEPLARKVLATMIYAAIVRRFLLVSSYRQVERHFWQQARRHALNMPPEDLWEAIRHLQTSIDRHPEISGPIVYYYQRKDGDAS